MKLATLCYLRQEGKTLMLYRNKRDNDYHQGKWNGLGGKLKAGEMPEEGARREILEESGLSVDSLQLKGILTFPLFDGKEDWYVFVFLGFGAQGELLESDEGSLSWIEDEQLLSLELWPGDRVFLPWLDEARFFSGKLIYESGQFLSHDVVWYA